MGIEPTPAAWEAAVLPLNYTRSGAFQGAKNAPRPTGLTSALRESHIASSGKLRRFPTLDPAAMQIIVNGTPFDAPQPCTVTDLLRVMALEGQRCAVELNGDIVSRTDWPARAVGAGDRVEVVRAIGGG